MTTVEQLAQIFNDNFVAYFRSHMAHINIVGRNFQSDHALLGGIYEDLQGQIDHIGELIRTLNELAPCDISEVILLSEIPATPIEGDSIELLSAIYDDLETLKSCYQELITIAADEGHDEISNYAQDRVLAIAKNIWMLRSTLE